MINRKSMLSRKKEYIKRRQNLFVSRSSESLAMPKALSEIALVLAKKNKPFSDGEGIVKRFLHKITKWVGAKSIEKKS